MNWITVFVGLTGFILVSHVGISSGAVCSQAAIQTCSNQFIEKWATTNNDKLFSYRTDEEFNEMCDDFELYKKCLEPFKNTCSSTQIDAFDGEEDAYGYACGEGAEVYIRNSKCYQNETMQSEGKACVDSFNKKKEILDLLVTTAIESWAKEYCVVVNSLFNCIKQVVTTHCNEDLAEWQYTVDKKLLERTLELIDCSIDFKPGDSGWTTRTPPTLIPTMPQESTCTVENLQECFAQLLLYANSLPNNGRQVRWYDQQQLSHICRLYNDGQKCYSALDDSCDLNTRLQLEGVETAYEFMCKEGPSVYNISADCYLDSKLETSLVECANALKARSDPDTCRKINDYMMCVTQAFYAIGICSEASIRYQLSASRLAYTPLLANQLQGCRVEEQCAVSRERRCMELLDRHFSDYQKGILEKKPADTDEMCQGLVDKDMCLNPFKQYCPVRDRRVLRGFDGAARYICEDEGKAAYLQHMSCLSEAVRTEASGCYSRAMATVNTIESRPEFPSINSDLQQEYCQAITDDLLGCVRDVLSRSCHGDMVEYQYTVDSLIWGPTLDRFGCETNEKTSTATEGPHTSSPTYKTSTATEGPDTSSPTYSDPGSASFLGPFITLYPLCLLLCVQEIVSRASG